MTPQEDDHIDAMNAERFGPAPILPLPVSCEECGAATTTDHTIRVDGVRICDECFPQVWDDLFEDDDRGPGGC